MNQKIYLKAIEYLSRQELSKKKLKDKLLKKSFEEEEINEVLLFLEEKKYLSDERYFKLKLKSLLIHKKSGPLLINQKMAQEGFKIDKNDIDLMLQSQNYQLEESLSFWISKWLKKKHLSSVPEEMKERNKLIQFLCRKGHSLTDIFSHLKKVPFLVDEDAQ